MSTEDTQIPVEVPEIAEPPGPILPPLISGVVEKIDVIPPDFSDLQIPQYKDKTVFYNDESYPISTSFKGILRVTPNNTNTLAEKVGIQLSDAEIAASGENVAYRDTPDYSSQFIRVSDSDGYMVNLRFHDNSIESDNIWVRGEVATKNLIVGAASSNGSYDSLKLNGLSLAVYPDEDNMIEGNPKLNDEVLAPGISLINGDKDQSAILVSDLKGKLVYRNSSDLVNELIMDALLSLESVPTGSVHFFPITIEQYNKLTGRHNMYLDSDNTLSDPLIRDYLLCDGSEYYVKDFPELAKTLAGSIITTDEKTEGKEVRTRTKPDQNNSQDNSCSAITKDTTSERTTFRVPDLRGQFIRAAFMHPAYPFDKGSGDQFTAEPVGTHRWSQLPNSYPDEVSQDASKVTDKHVHFTAFGSYEHLQHSTWQAGKEDLQNQAMVQVLNGYDNYNASANFTFPGLSTAPSQRNYDGRENSMPTNYYLSAPLDYDYSSVNNESTAPNVGLSGKNITMTTKAGKDEFIENSSLKGTSINDDKFEYPESLLGQENTPIYIACLPLIKI